MDEIGWFCRFCPPLKQEVLLSRRIVVGSSMSSSSAAIILRSVAADLRQCASLHIRHMIGATTPQVIHITALGMTVRNADTLRWRDKG
ncbi:hypothetical protein H351_32055 (plasmid) [Rhodococcus erythropolis R138]|nr:hypothetical protein H351_32055 [Rhodococcus erythropolis R138]